MFFGSGVLRGLGVTLKNFFYSFFKKPDEGGIFTVQYPEQRLPEKERFRNFPFLVYDEQPENLRCVACDICAKECPPKCIYIVRDFDKEGRPLKRPAVFDIDFTVCMNCGLCEEACPFDAIYMDHEFEIADSNRQSKLLYHRDELLKSNKYFHKIRPTHAAEVDTRRREAEEKKAAAARAAKERAEAQKKAKEAEARKAAEAQQGGEEEKEKKPSEEQKDTEKPETGAQDEKKTDTPPEKE